MSKQKPLNQESLKQLYKEGLSFREKYDHLRIDPKSAKKFFKELDKTLGEIAKQIKRPNEK